MGGHLAAVALARLSKRGRYGDGNGLWFQVSAFGTRAWIFRYTVAGRARSMGLGAYPDVSLKEARQRAEVARRQLRDGIDPIEARRAQKMAVRLEAAKRITFAQCVDDYLRAHAKAWRNEKHRQQWRSTLATYALPLLGKLPVAAIDTGLVLRVLRPIWREKPETAARLRGRIERILAWATVSGHRSGENPARWRGHLQEMLPAKGKLRRVRHHPAFPYRDLPALMQRLQANDSLSARALEFCILTAARTGEVIGATWDEIDLDAKLWIVPGERMKAGKEHRVPLCDRAVDLLATLPRERGSPFVFAGASKGRPLSNMAMLQLLRGLAAGYTVHGFRSTFRDWAAEMTNHPREIVEAALAHTLANKVEAAYQRGDLLDKRRRLMRDWARFCTMPPLSHGTVTPLRRASEQA